MGLLIILCAVLRISAASSFQYTLNAGPLDLDQRVVARAQAWLQVLSTGGVNVTVAVGRASSPLITDAELAQLPSESFVVRSSCNAGEVLIGARGNARTDSPWGDRLGNHFALYRVMQLIGVHFLHPLQPTVTRALSLPIERLCAFELISVPQWQTRIWHYHTQVPPLCVATRIRIGPHR